MAIFIGRRTDLGTKKGTKRRHSRTKLPPFFHIKNQNAMNPSINPRKMLTRQTRNFAKASWSSPFLSSCLFSSTSSPPSPTHLVPGAAADVADVTGADDLVYIDPPVSSSVKPLITPTLLQPRVVVYDGVCHLCHGGVKWIIGVDKYSKIKFCCLQSKAAEPYLRLCGLDREDVLRRFLFVEGPESYHQASTAALKVLSYLPLPYSALSSLLIIPSPLRDAAYDYVAKRRYDWFGKSEDCLVLQEKELLERFIDRDEMMMH